MLWEQLRWHASERVRRTLRRREFLLDIQRVRVDDPVFVDKREPEQRGRVIEIWSKGVRLELACSREHVMRGGGGDEECQGRVNLRSEVIVKQTKGRFVSLNQLCRDLQGSEIGY